MTSVVISPPAPARVIRARAARVRITTGVPRTGPRPTVALVHPGGHRDVFLIVDALTRQTLAELRSARITDKPTWVLNGVGKLGITVSAWDDGLDWLVDPSTVVDGAGVLQLLGREIQWWRDGVFRWAGVPLTATPDIGSATVAIGAQDLGWYLTRKVFGAGERRDLLAGAGQMDRPGLSGWVRSGVTAVDDTVVKDRGRSSARVSGTGSIAITRPHDSTDLVVALPVHVTGVVRLPAGTPVGTPIATITVRGMSSSEILDQKVIVSDADTKLGTWWRFGGYALLPPGAPHRVTTELMSLGTHGDTWFDDVRTYKNDTTGYVAPGADLTVHGVAAIRHVQFDARQRPGFGFRTRVLTASGTVEPLGVRHAPHQQITDFLSGYVDRADGFEWWIDPTTREVLFAHRRGKDHTDVVLHERAVTAGKWNHDESTVSTMQIVLGEGDGADRPEGVYVDRTRARGLLLDDVHQPPDGTPLAALDPMARRLHAENSQPQSNPMPITCSAKEYFDVLNPGDRIRLAARCGKLRLASTLVRIGEIGYDVDAEQLELA